MYRFNLKGGGKIVTLPPQLLNKHCVINIDCVENCFNYAVLSALHHSEFHDPQRVTGYDQYLNDYDFPSLPTVTASQVSKFVKTNNLPVFTHLYHSKKATDESYVECTYAPPKHLLLTSQERVHLLLFDGHWMPITNLSALYRKYKGTFKMCETCLASFYNNDRYQAHLPCTPDKYIQIENMQTEDMKFKDFNKCVDLADIVYADMESILQKCNTDDDDDDEVDSHLLQKHIPLLCW